MVAITQGRSHRMVDIRPGRLARFLVRFVTRPGYGIGLGTAETMQLAIDEVGAPRILLAAVVSGLTKPFGVHGLFYRIAGPPGGRHRRADQLHHPAVQRVGHARARAIPDGAARRLAAALDQPVAVIDANDAGVNVLGASPGVDRQLVRRLFADNPLGQSREQTPIAVVRRVDWPAGPAAAAGAEAAPHAALGRSTLEGLALCLSLSD